MAFFDNLTFLTFSFIIFVTQTACRPFQNKVLLISFDGFPVSYLQQANKTYPTFERLRREGVFSDTYQNVFPGETFPNHFSMVTGLYPEQHGIVSNLFYDPAIDRTFVSQQYGKSAFYRDRRWWSGGEPIWSTVRRLNISRLKIATSMWPGDLADFDHKPYRFRSDFDSKVPLETRIDQALEWLNYDDCDMVLMFHFEPDDSGHVYGCTGPEIESVIDKIDRQIANLLTRMDDHGLTERTNLILLSDHGMAPIKTIIRIDDFIDVNLTTHHTPRVGAHADLWPRPGYEDYVYNTLQRAAANMPGVFEVYRRSDIPDRLHYNRNQRIAPIFVLGYPGTFVLEEGKVPRYLRFFKAIHGWDPTQAGQHPIFIARGPSFKNGGFNASEITQGMSAKDIYALLVRLLHLDMNLMPQNVASFSKIEPLLKH